MAVVSASVRIRDARRLPRTSFRSLRSNISCAWLLAVGVMIGFHPALASPKKNHAKRACAKSYCIVGGVHYSGIPKRVSESRKGTTMRGASTRLNANQPTRLVEGGQSASVAPSRPMSVDVRPGRGSRRSDFQWMQETLTRVQEELSTSREAEELHRLLFEKVPYPRFLCDAKTFRFLEANEAAVRDYGYSREEFLRMRLRDLNAPEENADVHGPCQSACPTEKGKANKAMQLVRHRKQDGTVIDVEMDSALVALKGRSVFLVLAQDVTERRRADQRLQAQHATTQALAESSTLAEASPKIFQAICENLGCDWGELWRVDPAAQVLRCTQTWQGGEPPLPGRER